MKYRNTISAGIAAVAGAGALALAVPAQAAPACQRTSSSISCTTTNGSVAFVATPGGGLSVSGTAGDRAFNYSRTTASSTISSTGGIADVSIVKDRATGELKASATVAGKTYSYDGKPGSLPKVTVTDAP